MSFTIRLMAASAVALGLVAAPVMAQDARAIRAAEQVRDQALKGNIALDYVTQITTRFGPRPAGSRAEQDASAWAADYMRAHGFQNVRIEQFPLIGWERGEESAEILGARPQKLVAAALGHSIATPAEGVEAEVVFFDGLDALLAAPAGSLTGKIAVVDGGQMVRMQDGSGYGPCRAFAASARPRRPSAARSPSSCARPDQTNTACRTPAPPAMSRARCRCPPLRSARRTPIRWRGWWAWARRCACA
nr:hypothetical protein [Brevundimonas diminuta]